MPAQPLPAITAPTVALDVQAEHEGQVLRELTDIGAKIARKLDGMIEAATTPKQVQEIADAFDRVSRAIRRTVLLAQHLRQNAHAYVAQRAAARTRIRREVEAKIERAAADPAETAPLKAELVERLDDPAMEFDLTSRPVPEIIAEICRDLGLAQTTAAPARPPTLDELGKLHAQAARRILSHLEHPQAANTPTLSPHAISSSSPPGRGSG